MTPHCPALTGRNQHGISWNRSPHNTNASTNYFDRGPPPQRTMLLKTIHNTRNFSLLSVCCQKRLQHFINCRDTCCWCTGAKATLTAHAQRLWHCRHNTAAASFKDPGPNTLNTHTTAILLPHQGTRCPSVQPYLCSWPAAPWPL